MEILTQQVKEQVWPFLSQEAQELFSNCIENDDIRELKKKGVAIVPVVVSEMISDKLTNKAKPGTDVQVGCRTLAERLNVLVKDKVIELGYTNTFVLITNNRNPKRTIKTVCVHTFSRHGQQAIDTYNHE